MQVLISILISTIAVFVSAYILPGVSIETLPIALVVAIVLGLINAVVRPFVIVLTLPINILTLGLFTFVIMALMVLLTSWVVPAFEVGGFWWAMAFALVYSLVNSFLLSLRIDQYSV